MLMTVVTWAGIGLAGFLIVCGLIAVWRGCRCTSERSCKN